MIFGIFLQKTITATIFYGKSADSLIMVSQLLYIKGAPPLPVHEILTCNNWSAVGLLW